jgi:hypothetical protein
VKIATPLAILLVTLSGCNRSGPPPVQLVKTPTKPDTPVAAIAGIKDPPIPYEPTASLQDTVDYREQRFLPSGAAYSVIAISGAPLLKEPHTGAPAITTAKYGETVEIIEKMHRDTLQDPISENDMKGTWVKVKHHQQEGYMFSAFLASGKYVFTDANDFDILLKGTSCVPNFKFAPWHHYYAIYNTGDGGFLKQVRISFYVTHEIPEGVDIWEWYTIDTDFYGSPAFILGAPKTLGEKTINTVSAGTFKPGTVHQHGAYRIKVESKYDGFYTVLNFVDASGKTVQSIETENLMWCGDMDQDGKLDFLYLEGEAKAGSVVLALSSYAAPGHAFKIVGNYETSSCC